MFARSSALNRLVRIRTALANLSASDAAFAASTTCANSTFAAALRSRQYTAINRRQGANASSDITTPHSPSKLTEEPHPMAHPANTGKKELITERAAGHPIPTGPRSWLKSPPRQPRNFRPTPPRSPSPPPLPSEPSADYLSIASQAPSSLKDECEQGKAAPRKLLILDLNGTLLIRSARGAPHPRPFMPSFRDYLLHAETKKWLDVMIWSSAQPHNVDKMVQKCFFPSTYDSHLPGSDVLNTNDNKWEGNLLAVWARDTLGLSNQAYFRKTQTTKDLNKPWREVTQGLHSALTTILLDDSPLKARLQPYNHVCIPEYNGKAREKDLQVKNSASGNTAHFRLQESIPEDFGSDMSISPVEARAGDVDSRPATSDRRKEKKERKRQEKEAAKRVRLQQGVLDETLLAVVGILDEMKQQENVAAWIKHGGLWAGNWPPSDNDAMHAAESADETQNDPDTSSTTPAASSPKSLDGVLQRQESVNSDDETETAKKERSSVSGSFTGSRSDWAAGNDAESGTIVPGKGADRVYTSSCPQVDSSLRNGQDGMDTLHMEKWHLWFEHPETLAYWTSRGRNALQEFRIEEDDGVELDPTHYVEAYRN